MKNENQKKIRKTSKNFIGAFVAQAIFDIIDEQDDLDNIEMNDDENLTDNVSILNKIVKLNNKLNEHKQKEFTHYIEIGELLINLKLRYLKKCYQCAENDGLDCLNCLSCSRMSTSEIKQFFVDVKSVVSFGQSYVNLLISVGRLSKKYRKFKLITCSIYELKTHMSELKERMCTDEGF